MPAYEHVACCVDTGATSPRALKAAASVWGDAPTRLSAVFVAPPAEVLHGGLTEWDVDEGDPFGPPRAWLEGLAAGSGAEPVLLAGEPPHEAVFAWLRESDADLVVATAHNRRVVRAFVGGFATALAHGAPVDTLILPASEPADGPVRRIVCCVDGGPDGAQALRATRRLADVTGAPVSLVHVVEPPVPVGKDLVADTLRMPEGREREGHAVLDAAAEELPGAEPVLLAGTADRAVAAWAEEAGAGVIVAGPRSGGRHGLGGFASGIIRAAPCAVLLARGDSPGP